MSEVAFEHIFDIDLEIGGAHMIGESFQGRRIVVAVKSGEISGPKLAGKVLPGTAGDWVVRRPDGVLSLDVRLTIETHDGALIYMKYHGFRHGPKEVIRRLEKGEAVDPAEYYFRTSPSFETGDERYAWLNNIVAVGVGRATRRGPFYEVYQLL